MPDPDECPYEWEMKGFVSSLPHIARGEKLWKEAHEARSRGNLDSAVALLTELLKVPVYNPEGQVNALLVRGLTFSELKQYPAALKDFKEVADSRHASPREVRLALVMLGLIHRTLGNVVESRAAYEASLVCADPTMSDDLRRDIETILAELAADESALNGPTSCNLAPPIIGVPVPSGSSAAEMDSEGDRTWIARLGYSLGRLVGRCRKLWRKSK